jgi:DMSO/TMAO reductase YedYZ molybdopterin-dependent catalytic subunit
VITSAGLDRLLALLLLLILATGALTLRAGAPSAGWVFALHALLGGALLAAVALKVARSAPRAAARHRWVALTFGLVLAAVVLGALGGGFYWAASGHITVVGPWTVLTIHSLLGLAVVALVAMHLLPWRWRLLRPANRSVARGVLFSRRWAITAGVLSFASVFAYGVAAGLERLNGGERRFTGSRWLPRGTIPPSTTFLGEGVPVIDLATWQLNVRGRVDRPRSYTLAELRAAGEQDVAAVLDCTSGWAVDTTWTGVSLGSITSAAGPDPAAKGVIVRSVTGWGAVLGPEEAAGTLLATQVAGVPLPLENGAPCRLVVPGRRGLDWVKWVAEVEVI